MRNPPSAILFLTTGNCVYSPVLVKNGVMILGIVGDNDNSAAGGIGKL